MSLYVICLVEASLAHFALIVAFSWDPTAGSILWLVLESHYLGYVKKLHSSSTSVEFKKAEVGRQTTSSVGQRRARIALFKGGYVSAYNTAISRLLGLL